LCDLPVLTNPNVIRGMDTLDDAGVYRLSDDLAIIQTVDFFTPIVDDPYMFGQIAAANSLSDVYTMGGTPVTALNLVCFPVQSMDISVLKDILRGGVDKMAEANVVLIGGHSVDDTELKYGLSVTGTVHPDKLVTNSGARPGDRLILTKPLGTGIVNTAVKADMAEKETVRRVTESMAALNARASELMLKAGVNACTDITGFGFIGHAMQIAKNSRVCLEIDSTAVPYFPEAAEFAKMGLCPAGLHRNRDFYSPNTKIDGKVPLQIQDILFDPQTSGGLFIALEATRAKKLLQALRQSGVRDAAIIGEIKESPEGMITVR
jgi:selenide,water dikinase